MTKRAKQKKAKTLKGQQEMFEPSPAWLKMQEKSRARKRGGAGSSESSGTGPGLDWPDPVDRDEPGGAFPRPRRPRTEKRAERILALKDKTLKRIDRPHDPERHCPMCLMPDYIQSQGWPEPCRVRVSEHVECADTESAQHIGHHHDCTFWDHTDAVPF